MTYIEQDQWEGFLKEFSERNKGRRARFELFIGNNVEEESREGVFSSASVSGDSIIIDRIDNTGSNERTMSDELKNVHGISVQHDTDNSENTIQFMDKQGDVAILHFESMVDGDS